MGCDYFEGKEEHISDMVRQGYTCGYNPSWSLDVEPTTQEDEFSMDTISNLIQKGNVEGYSPRWFLSPTAK